MPIQIHTAQYQDLNNLAALDAQCNPNAWTVAQFQAALTAPHDTVLLAKQEGQIAGFIVWQHICDEIELHLIATAPHMRRRGIAGKLLQKLFQAAAENQVQRILLEVRQSNIAAQALYAAHGFILCGRRKNYYGGVEDAVLMEKLC